MRIRPYIPSKDYEYLSKWIDDERTHAFWCANLLPYPITRKSFHDLLEKNAKDQTDSAYVATEYSGQSVGFFCYSVNTTDDFDGVTLSVYDRERTICDCFKYRSRLDSEMFSKALNAYVNDTNKNLQNLSHMLKNSGFIKKLQK